jgi:uncharacterized membrane protein
MINLFLVNDQETVMRFIKLPNFYGWGSYGIMGLGIFLFLLVLSIGIIAVSELIILFIDIEKNTRKTSEK